MKCTAPSPFCECAECFSAKHGAHSDASPFVNDVLRAMEKVRNLPQPILAVVCSSGKMHQLKEKQLELGIDDSQLIFATVPVYEKANQAEDYKVFYDYVELQKYLAANSK